MTNSPGIRRNQAALAPSRRGLRQYTLAGILFGTVFPIVATAIRLVQSGLIDLRSVVSHQFPLSDGASAFAFAEKRGGLKVLICP